MDLQKNELSHHGILGQKWGVRRYQNEDGSLTEAGKKRYGSNDLNSFDNRRGLQNRLNDLDKAIAYNKRKRNDAIRAMSGKSSILDKVGDKDLYGKKEKLEAEKMIKKGEAEVNKLISKYKSKYSMSTKETRRIVNDGREVVKSLLATAAINAVTIPTIGYAGAYYVNSTMQGTKYKVKDKKEL